MWHWLSGTGTARRTRDPSFLHRTQHKFWSTLRSSSSSFRHSSRITGGITKFKNILNNRKVLAKNYGCSFDSKPCKWHVLFQLLLQNQRLLIANIYKSAWLVESCSGHYKRWNVCCPSCCRRRRHGNKNPTNTWCVLGGRQQQGGPMPSNRFIPKLIPNSKINNEIALT